MWCIKKKKERDRKKKKEGASKIVKKMTILLSTGPEGVAAVA